MGERCHGGERVFHSDAEFGVRKVPQAELARLRSELPRLMAGVAQLSVPLLVEVGAGPNWERAH